MTDAESGVILIWFFSGFMGLLLLDSMVWGYHNQAKKRNNHRFSMIDEPNTFSAETVFWAALLGSFGGIFILFLALLMAFGMWFQEEVLKHDIYRGFAHDL